MKFRYLILMVVFGVFCGATSSLAHHARAPYYDTRNTVTLSGTVTKLEWINPHTYIYLDVKSPAGSIDHWMVELYPPNYMTRFGVGKDTIKIGDTLTVHGMAPRPGADFAYLPENLSPASSGRTPHVTFALELTLADGTRVSFRSTP